MFDDILGVEEKTKIIKLPEDSLLAAWTHIEDVLAADKEYRDDWLNIIAMFLSDLQHRRNLGKPLDFENKALRDIVAENILSLIFKKR